MHWAHIKAIWQCYVLYRVSPQKSGTLDFCYFDIRKYSIFKISSDKTLSSEKNDTKIIGWVVLIPWSFLKTVIFNFLFILVTFQSGVMAFLTSIHCCLEAHWSVQTKQRENLWTATCIPTVNSSCRFTKFLNDCVSRNGCRINTTDPNQMILVTFFSEDNVLSDEIKICSIFEYQSNENRAFRFSWDTRYSQGLWLFWLPYIVAREPIDPCKTKQRENLWTAIPAVNSSRRFIKFVNDCVSRNGCRINTIEPNQMILVSFFSDDNTLSDEIKICSIFEYQSNENRAFRFFGDTRYSELQELLYY